MKRQAEIAASANLKIELIARKGEETLENLYTKNPALRPSPATLAADALREQANDIESAEMQMFIDKAIAKRIQTLSICRNQIAAGLQP